MKKADWKIFIAAIIYTLLFYKQDSGLNFLMFSIVISILSLLQDTEKIKKTAWLATATGTIISGALVFYYGTNLPKAANIISLILLAGFTFKTNTSLILSAFNAFTSLVLALPLLVLNFFRNKKNPDAEKPQKRSLFKKVILLLFPLFVVFVFFVLYRDSNPLFLKITEDINIDWLSFPLVKHFLVGLLFMYAFFVHRTINRLNTFDENKVDDIDFVDEEKHKTSFFSRFISLESETYTALVLLSMLNILIAFSNGIDINFLWLKNPLPQGLVFSEYLHSGTFALITSIVLAITIIVFFFRGIFNFNKKGKLLKILGFLWIFQNIIMVVSAILRNHMYISDYGYTHKRIGVYVFLGLAVIGLVMAFIKIAQKKNIWFLFRKNAWAFYTVLIIASFVNWDYVITDHNIKLANKNNVVDLDKDYLGNLSHTNTSVLAHIESNEIDYFAYQNTANGRYNISPLQKKIQKLLDYENRNQWQEVCLNKNKNIQELKKLNEMGKIAKLELYSLYLEDITEYESLSNIKVLDLHHNDLKNNLKGLKNYPKVEVLNLYSNEISSLDSFPNLENLTHLNLSQNDIKDYSKLERTPNLIALDLSSTNDEIIQDEFPVLKYLESINISMTKFDEWTFLENQASLKEIIFTNSGPYQIKIPNIESLEKVDLNSTQLLNDSGSFLDSLSVVKTSKEMNLYNCKMGSVYYLLNENQKDPLFLKLETLNLAHNGLQSGIKYLDKYTNLKDLDLSSNSINNIEVLESLLALRKLKLDHNDIYKFETLQKLTNLNELSMSNVDLNKLDDIISLENLKDLDISNNKLKDIDSIFKLQKLEYLNVSNNRIKDLNVLAKLENLKTLNISGMDITDYTFLDKMTFLEKLFIGNVPLELVEELKEKLPNTAIDYYSRNLGKGIMYDSSKRVSYSEDFDF